MDPSRWHWAMSTKRYRSDTVSAEHHPALPLHSSLAVGGLDRIVAMTAIVVGDL
jgi:hypothetical protein